VNFDGRTRLPAEEVRRATRATPTKHRLKLVGETRAELEAKTSA
jgi:hypothetical protein